MARSLFALALLAFASPAAASSVAPQASPDSEQPKGAVYVTDFADEVAERASLRRDRLARLSARVSRANDRAKHERFLLVRTLLPAWSESAVASAEEKLEGTQQSGGSAELLR